MVADLADSGYQTRLMAIRDTLPANSLKLYAPMRCQLRVNSGYFGNVCGCPVSPEYRTFRGLRWRVLQAAPPTRRTARA